MLLLSLFGVQVTMKVAMGDRDRKAGVDGSQGRVTAFISLVASHSITKAVNEWLMLRSGARR